MIHHPWQLPRPQLHSPECCCSTDQAMVPAVVSVVGFIFGPRPGESAGKREREHRPIKHKRREVHEVHGLLTIVVLVLVQPFAAEQASVFVVLSLGRSVPPLIYFVLKRYPRKLHEEIDFKLTALGLWLRKVVKHV